MKATELLTKHEKSDSHRASVGASALAEMAKKRGIIEQMRSASEEEKRKNCEMLIKLIRSLLSIVYHILQHFRI